MSGRTSDVKLMHFVFRMIKIRDLFLRKRIGDATRFASVICYTLHKYWED